MKRSTLVVIALIGTLCVLGWFVNYAVTRGSCAWYGKQTERETRYGPFIGCMVKSGDHWIPKREIRTAVQ